MNTMKWNIGIIGAGRIAETYAKALSRSMIARLHAVADVNAGAAEALAAAHGCQSFASHRAMIDGADLSAVIVCTPPLTHPAICVDAARRGLHVLCEKPFAICSDEARVMIEAARLSRVMITMASKFRYVEDVQRARELLGSGLLGEPDLLEVTFTARVDMETRWNSNATISGGGVLMDNGSHAMDIARYLLGSTSVVRAFERKRLQGLPVEETVRVALRSKSGVLGHLYLSWSASDDQESYLDVYGSLGVLSVGWKQSCYRLYSSPEWIAFGHGYDKLAAFTAQIDNFVRACRGEEPARITAEDALASVQAIESAYHALRRQPIPFAQAKQTADSLAGASLHHPAATGY